jgi:hypothetical protein
MPIDPNIALGYRGVEAPNPLAQYAQVTQIQNAQNQNALNQLQMRAAQRGEQDIESVRNALAGVQYGTPDYDKALTGAFLKTGNVKGLQDYQKGQRETDKAGAELQIKNLELQRDIFGNLAQNPSDENVKAHLQDMLIQKRITAQEANGWLTKTATMDPAQRKTLFTDLAMKANDRVGYEVSRANNAATVGATIRGQNLTDVRERERIKLEKDRIANAENPNAVARQTVDDSGKVTNYNKFGQIINTVAGAGKQSATFAKTEAQKKTMGKDLELAISELANITKDGGLIDQSTGSYIGKAVDIGARAFGKATSGDVAAGKLAPIADLALKMVPRFEGPQSNADTASYKQAAGQLADSTLPSEIRKEAGKEVLRLMKARKNQFITSDMASGNTAVPSGVAPPEGFVPD